MRRRDFLKLTLASGVAGLSPLTGRRAEAAIANSIAPPRQPIVVFIHLAGGPDLRYLLPPAFDSDPASYGYRYWQVKAAAHGLDPVDPAAWEQRWINDYRGYAANGADFGILNRAGWLQNMWEAGNVALVNNVIGGVSRNHAHCQLILDQGNVDSSPQDVERSGWGGRLAQFCGGHVASLTSTPRNFCFGAVDGQPDSRTDAPLIAIADSRNIALYQPAPGDERKGAGEVARSLKAYYAAKRQEMAADSVFRRFVDHEAKARQFGDQINAALASEPIPPAIEALYQGDNTLTSTYFGLQIRNLRDSLALANTLNLCALSMEYGGWDSHKGQKDFIEPKLEDLFGLGKGLDTLYQEIPREVADKLVFVIAGEFGRQLKANGAGGCDHGRGNTLLVIGNPVNGFGADKVSTAYGDMFPLEELDRLDQKTPDINGQTSIEPVLARVCDYVAPGAGNAVFPNHALRIVEPGVDLDGLLG